MVRTKKQIKNSGATFTPNMLADYLATLIYENVTGEDSLSILDPSCGEGALLCAAQRVFGERLTDYVGFDTDVEYLKKANIQLQSHNILATLHNDDFLSSVSLPDDIFESNVNNSVDIVIANPPYVRTQNLGAEKSQLIAKKFNLSGRVDLYYPFIIGITQALKSDGILGVITSNKYLSNKSGADIREFLRRNYDILSVIDLGDTKLFDAAVLPAILIGKKKKVQNQFTKECNCLQIYETQPTASHSVLNTVYDVLLKKESGIYRVGDIFYKLKVGKICFPNELNGCWEFTDDADLEWINNIRNNTAFYIGDKFKVRVGVKSCADNVFLNTGWDSEEFVPEDVLMRKMISQDNIRRWRCDIESCPKVLYPHYENSGKKAVFDIEDFPNAKHYLESHKEQLSSREYLINAGRNWYEFWVPQDPRNWKYPKVVFPDISTSARFSYDDTGAIVNGNCYWISSESLQDLNLLLLIEGVANSDLMEKYHSLCFNNKLYSGRKRFLTQYIEKYPIPDPDNKYSKQIVSLVKIINITTNDKDICELEAKINSLVCKAFGVSE